jgi:hypothetical protein
MLSMMHNLKLIYDLCSAENLALTRTLAEIGTADLTSKLLLLLLLLLLPLLYYLINRIPNRKFNTLLLPHSINLAFLNGHIHFSRYV